MLMRALVAVLVVPTVAFAQFEYFDPMRRTVVEADLSLFSPDFGRSRSLADSSATTAPFSSTLEVNIDAAQEFARAAVDAEMVFEPDRITGTMVLSLELSPIDFSLSRNEGHVLASASASVVVSEPTCVRIRSSTEGPGEFEEFFFAGVNGTNVDRFVAVPEGRHDFFVVQQYRGQCETSGCDEVMGITAMGAYEVRAVSGPCDRVAPFGVDAADLLDFVSLWFATTGETVVAGDGADADGDGVIGVADVLAFLACWFEGGTACA